MATNQNLNDVTVAILMTDGFKQAEFTEPRRALLEAGATVKVVALEGGQVKGWDKTGWGESFDVDVIVSGGIGTVLIVATWSGLFPRLRSLRILDDNDTAIPPPRSRSS